MVYIYDHIGDSMVYNVQMNVLIVFLLVLLVAGIMSYFSFYYRSRLFGKMLIGVNTDEKVIAVTYDDGPNGQYTVDIAKAFERVGGKATFFMVAKNATKHKSTINYLLEKHHEVGLHSYSHAFHKYITDPLFNNELTRSQDIMNNIGLSGIKYFRFPWLYRNPWVYKSVASRGYVIVSGQFAHGLEPFQVNSTKIYRHCLKIAKPGSIIIFHDGYNGEPEANRKQTLEATQLLINNLHSQGYKFVSISELLQYGKAIY